MAGVSRHDGRDIARIVDRHAHGRSRLDRVHGLLPWRQRPQGRSHASGVVIVGLNPPRPVVQQPVAHRNRAPVHGVVQPVPYFRLREYICRSTHPKAGITRLIPVVPSRIPHREGSVRVRVHDNAWNRGAPGRPFPSLITSHIARPPRRKCGSTTDVNPDSRRLRRVMGSCGWPDVMRRFTSFGQPPVSAHQITSRRKLLPSPLSPVTRFTRVAKSSAISGAGPTLSSFKCSIMVFLHTGAYIFARSLPSEMLKVLRTATIGIVCGPIGKGRRSASSTHETDSVPRRFEPGSCLR